MHPRVPRPLGFKILGVGIGKPAQPQTASFFVLVVQNAETPAGMQFLLHQLAARWGSLPPQVMEEFREADGRHELNSLPMKVSPFCLCCSAGWAWLSGDFETPDRKASLLHLVQCFHKGISLLDQCCLLGFRVQTVKVQALGGDWKFQV